VLDRWILSDLNRLIRTAHESYDGFDVQRLCLEVRGFIDDLSTWYVRRSRRRFYGQGWPTDKCAAYATLYEVLTTLNRIIAPIVPFMAETIYQNLVAGQIAGSPSSVHHAPFPLPDETRIDESLSALVAASIKLVSLGRSARKDSDLKIRQPLAELVIVPGSDLEERTVDLFRDHFLEELNVKKVTLGDTLDGLVTITVEPNMKTVGPKFGREAAAAREAIGRLNGRIVADSFARGQPVFFSIEGRNEPLDPADVTIRTSYLADWAGAADGKTVVLIDKRLTPALKNEGLARDIVRNVQNLRKDAGLEINDRIVLSLVSDAPALRAAMDQFDAYIREETLAATIRHTLLPNPISAAEVRIDGAALQLALGRRE